MCNIYKVSNRKKRTLCKKEQMAVGRTYMVGATDGFRNNMSEGEEDYVKQDDGRAPSEIER